MSKRVNTWILGRNFVFAALAVCLQSVALRGEDLRPTLTPKELRQRLLDSHAKIHAWYIEYTGARTEARIHPHRVVAAKAPDQFYHWSAHWSHWSDWRDDIYQQRLTISPLKSVIERPAHRQFQLLPLRPNDPLPGTMPQEFLFLALGWWPFPQRPSPMFGQNAPCTMPAIANSLNYIVKPWQEIVRGRWCHILEFPGHDKLWLDCERGCTILRREIYHPDKGVLIHRIESSEHQEVQSGIWVPFEFRNILFNAEGLEPQKDIILDAVLTVLEVRLNDQVQDSMFHFEPRPGSIQTLADDRTEQSVPGGTDYLDQVADWIKRRFEFSEIPAQSMGSTTEAFIEYGILGGGIVLTIGLFVRRRRRCEHTSISVVEANRRSRRAET